ncbi:MAG: hypothetical protein P1V97_27615 [Planctomycetota bacterium]|nr:hypothetical protein [Planctomycetota bacterium]
MDVLQNRVKEHIGGIVRIFDVETRQKGKKYRTRVYEKVRSDKMSQTTYMWRTEDEARLAHELIVRACEERSSHASWPKMALERILELQARLERETRMRRDLERSKPF